MKSRKLIRQKVSSIFAGSMRYQLFHKVRLSGIQLSGSYNHPLMKLTIAVQTTQEITGHNVLSP